MKISAKTRYALTTMIYLGELYETQEFVPLVEIADKQKLSKIYLEQVFGQLKRSDLVLSLKGAMGGYKLVRSPYKISIYEIINCIEPLIFSRTENTVAETYPEIDEVLQERVFEKINKSLVETLENVSLYDLIVDVNGKRSNFGYMDFI